MEEERKSYLLRIERGKLVVYEIPSDENKVSKDISVGVVESKGKTTTEEKRKTK